MNTPRYSLPYLAVAQAHKEITYNEALAKIDALLHPLVEARLATPPSGLAAGQAGQCWLVDADANDAWQGHEGDIASWTGASWRFVQPVEGMQIRERLSSRILIHFDNEWTSGPSIADPAGGATIDVECRAAMGVLLSYLRTAGILSV